MRGATAVALLGISGPCLPGKQGSDRPHCSLQSIPWENCNFGPDFVLFLGDGSGFGEILNQGSERLKTPTAGPPVPPPASRRFRRPLEAMREKEVHPKQVKVMANREQGKLCLWASVSGLLKTAPWVWVVLHDSHALLAQLHLLQLCSNFVPYVSVSGRR